MEKLIEQNGEKTGQVDAAPMTSSYRAQACDSCKQTEILFHFLLTIGYFVSKKRQFSLFDYIANIVCFVFVIFNNDTKYIKQNNKNFWKRLKFFLMFFCGHFEVVRLQFFSGNVQKIFQQKTLTQSLKYTQTVFRTHSKIREHLMSLFPGKWSYFLF